MDSLSGVVKWFGEKKYGFIMDESNREIFFHINDCRGFSPKENMSVEFEIGLDRIGRVKAMNIKPVRVGVCDENCKG